MLNRISSDSADAQGLGRWSKAHRNPVGPIAELTILLACPAHFRNSLDLVRNASSFGLDRPDRPTQ